jgi:hypothetical protein
LEISNFPSFSSKAFKKPENLILAGIYIFSWTHCIEVIFDRIQFLNPGLLYIATFEIPKVDKKCFIFKKKYAFHFIELELKMPETLKNEAFGASHRTFQVIPQVLLLLIFVSLIL